jgi:myo-inositol-1(or 4)-monophosphatase
VRRFGAASLDLAWVAAGRFDGFWERNLKPWDVAAGVLMVTESGGKVTTIEEHGNPVDGVSILAANQELHPQYLERLRAAQG